MSISNSLVCGTHEATRTVNLFLVRHGRSEHNEQGVYNSYKEYNHPLASNLVKAGEDVLAETAQRLSDLGIKAANSVAYVSPVRRTQQSAVVLQKYDVISSDFKINNHLTEEDAGDLNGVKVIDPATKKKRPTDVRATFGYERQGPVCKRVGAFIKDLLKSLHEGETANNIVVVSHLSVVENLNQQLLKRTEEIAEGNIDVEIVEPGKALQIELKLISQEGTYQITDYNRIF